MIFRTLDSLDDWTFGNGINSFSTGRDAMIQNLKTRLRQWKGECFFDPDNGVDWNNFMDIGTKALLDSDILRVILQSDGIIRVDSFLSTLTPDTRNLNVQATLFTFYGNLSLNEVF